MRTTPASCYGVRVRAALVIERLRRWRAHRHYMRYWMPNRGSRLLDRLYHRFTGSGTRAWVGPCIRCGRNRWKPSPLLRSIFLCGHCGHGLHTRWDLEDNLQAAAAKRSEEVSHNAP